MKNKEISDLFFEMSSLLELGQEDRFRIRAYAAAAQTLADLTGDAEGMALAGTLTTLPGIGAGLAAKIEEYCRTGKMAEHEKLKAKFPGGLLELLRVGGLGPKRVRFLYDELKIDSIEKLRKAAQDGRLRELQGFGAKMEENILKTLAGPAAGAQRMLISDARRLAQTIAERLRAQCRSIRQLEPAGSLRRWKESVGDLDFLCASDDPAEVMGAFARMPEASRILAEGPTKTSLAHRAGIQCDLRVVPPESFGAALLYFTGSKEHNVALRELALKKGLTINEYGLYDLKNKKKALAGRTEEEMYGKLGLEFIPPELRENRGEIAAALKKKLPKLVEEGDVRGDFHNHTKYSDGVNTLAEMAERARQKGWGWFVSADHSQSLKVARGLSREAVLKKKREITELNQGRRGFRVLLGSEVDILADGSLDYDAATLRELDFVVASVHTGFKQTEQQITGRIAAAMANPFVDIVGHLTGRLINRREGYAVNVGKVLAQAAATGTAVEINGQPERLDLYDYHAKAAGELGVKIALSSDAHSAPQLDFITYAVAVARRAWLTKDQIINCMELDELRAWKSA